MQFEFDEYLLDPERRELTRGSMPVDVGPQVFDLLLYLVRNRERVVSKDDLLAAVWSGRVVSESTMTSQINAVRNAIGDSGAAQRLVKTVPRKGFRFVGAVREAPVDPPAPSSPLPLRLPDKPSFAVLPFVNLSGDPEQDYFIDGVVEDIVAALSRIRWLFVISRDSSFTYKGRTVDVRQVGRELGVRYVLEGSMRKAGNRVRITGQLLDAATGTHIWAERYEDTLDDLFGLQDRISSSVAGCVAGQVERAEIERATRKPTESLDAYDYYLRGRAKLNHGPREAMSEALPLFEKAIELDPAFASAYGMVAWCFVWRKVNGWMVDRPREMAEGLRLARRAVELGKDDAVALCRGGHALSHFNGDLEGGLALIGRALTLDPNLAAAWYLGGYLKIGRGDLDGAIECFGRAMRLSPLDPEIFRMQGGIALAHFFARRLDEALAWGEKARSGMPSFLLMNALIAASHAASGRLEEARRALSELRRLEPRLRVSNLADWMPTLRAGDLAMLAEGLGKAGLPD